MSGVDDMPDLRSVDELLDLMGRLATACGTEADPARAAALFEEAYRLALELRVPRMPDTDEDLARMIDEAREGATFTTDEVFAHLRESQARSDRLRTRYRKHLASGRTADAARMLVPGDECMLPWTGDVAVTTSARGGRSIAYAVSTRGTAACTSRDEGLAALGAIMRLHRHRDLWMR